jgi:hypothetical protein
MRSDGTAIRKQLSGVVEENHTIAEQAPALFRMRGHDMGGLMIESLGRGTRRLVHTHFVPPVLLGATVSRSDENIVNRVSAPK